MDECPFCSQPIDEALARFGGTCPHCYGEIPGEEAATDHGPPPEPVREAQTTRRIALGLAALGGIVIGFSIMILVGAGWRLSRSSEASPERLDFDHIPLPEVVAVAPHQARAARVTSGRSRGADVYGASRATVDATDPTVALRDAAHMPSSPTVRRTDRRGTARAHAVPGVGTSAANRPAGTASLDLSLAGGTVERDDNVILDDPVAIRMMIGDRLRRGIAELRGCYDRRLKQRPDLAGRWRLTFVVSPEGRATEPELAGLDGTDPALEGCLREHVTRRWAFARVAEPTEVSKTLTFHLGK